MNPMQAPNVGVGGKDHGSRPRVHFCWACGNKLRGNHFAERKVPLGGVVIMHKRCAEEFDREMSDPLRRY